MKKFFDHIKPVLQVGVILLPLVISVCALCAVLSQSHRLKLVESQIETLSSDYLGFSQKIEIKLESIADNMDFLKDWCMQAPSVTLGDTYINESNSRKKVKN